MDRIENVNVTCKANVYFDGKVVSHTITDGARRRTIGLILWESKVRPDSSFSA